MSNVITDTAKTVFLPLFKFGRDATLRLAKIEAAKRYIKVVQVIHKAFLAYLSVTICLLLLLAGFLFMHVGLFGVIYLKLGVKIAVLACLAVGAIYSAGAALLIVTATSEKNWLKHAHCDDCLAPLLRDD